MNPSEVVYSSLTGAVTDFPVNIGYLEQAHVFAEVNGSVASFTWLASNIIRVTPAPVGTLRIYRATPSNPIADFENTGTLDAEVLDRALLQGIYLNEETRTLVDQRVEQLVSDAEDTLVASQALLAQAQDVVSHITISTSNPTGGAEGDIWFKVSI